MVTLRQRLQISILLGGIALAVDGASAADETPALIVQPTEQSREALQQLVSHTLGRESVRIADDALTQDSGFVVEPARVRNQQGQSVYDREIRVVEHFRLVRKGQTCILIRESTGERFALTHTQCTAKP